MYHHFLNYNSKCLWGCIFLNPIFLRCSAHLFFVFLSLTSLSSSILVSSHWFPSTSLDTWRLAGKGTCNGKTIAMSLTRLKKVAVHLMEDNNNHDRCREMKFTYLQMNLEIKNLQILILKRVLTLGNPIPSGCSKLAL